MILSGKIVRIRNFGTTSTEANKVKRLPDLRKTGLSHDEAPSSGQKFNLFPPKEINKMQSDKQLDHISHNISALHLQVEKSVQKKTVSRTLTLEVKKLEAVIEHLPSLPLEEQKKFLYKNLINNNPT